MDVRRIISLTAVGLISIFIFSSLGACSPNLFSGISGSGLDVQAQVNTAVAATLVDYMVKTKVAEKLTSNSATQVVQQAVPTATPTTAPTDTPLPTATATPEPTLPPPPEPTATAPAVAAIVSAPAPEISAQVNTNCRQGPSTYYKVAGYLMVGATSHVYGLDATHYWWYIENPTRKGEHCWVWSESTTVKGDVSGLPVIAASQYVQNEYYDACYSDNCYGGSTWVGNNFCTPYTSNGKVFCYPNPYYSNPNNWCNPGSWPNYCNVKVTWPNTCNVKVKWPNNCNIKVSWPNSCGKKQPTYCPLPTGNYWNYCNKYPKCCGLK